MAKILVAEDDPAMLDFLVLALERAGHVVNGSADGEEAVRILEFGGPFDLLLTDIVMPGMDGFDLTRRAMAAHPGIKVIYITGFSAVSMRHAGEDSSTARMLSKPFHLNQLVEQVENALREPVLE